MAEDSPDLCEDLRNVREGDDVTLTTTEHEALPATCTERDNWNDQDPEVVREYTVLRFEQEGTECMVQITDGLKRFEWEAEYPRHTPLFDETSEISLGHITGVKIHGSLEA